MNEIWLLPMWNLKLFGYIACPNIDFKKKFALRLGG